MQTPPQTQTPPKTLAIIGGGICGIVTAKYALSSGFTPLIFEKRSEIGGLWSNSGFMWPSMRTNSSKFTNEFSDFHWPDSQPLFPTPPEVLSFFKSYMTKNSLTKYIKFDSKVLTITHSEGVFSVEWVDLLTGKTEKRVFEHLIIATGYFSVPNYSGFEKFMKDSSNSGVEFVHSAHYKKAEEYRGKKVLVVGCSFSSTQIAAEVCEEAGNVVNCFREAAWCLPKFLKHPTYGKELPIDCLIYSRELVRPKEDAGKLSVEEKNRRKNEFFSKLSRQNEVDKELKLEERGVHFPKVAITSDYLGCVEKGKIRPVKTGVKDIRDGKVYFENGECIDVDVVILGTGFKNEISFIDQKILDSLDYCEKDSVMPLNLFNCTFHPAFKNLAFVGVFKGLFFGITELQAKYALQYLRGENSNSSEIIQETLNNQLNMRKLPSRPQFANGSYVEYCEKLAKEMGMMPDFKEINEKDPELYDFMLYGPLLICSYFLNDKDELRRKESWEHLLKVKKILIS